MNQVGSASKNAKIILQKLGILEMFDLGASRIIDTPCFNLITTN